MSMKEKNIKMNNMDLNEKKLIIDPLRKHIFHMKDWELKKIYLKITYLKHMRV